VAACSGVTTEAAGYSGLRDMDVGQDAQDEADDGDQR